MPYNPANSSHLSGNFVKKATADLADAQSSGADRGTFVARFRRPEIVPWPAGHGPKFFEDNSLVRTLLEEPGAGRVLVVDGGGSMRCALVGGNLAQLGVTNGWQGLVVFGCIRDCDEIRELPIGLKALGAHPRKSEKGLHTGHRDRPVSFAG